MEKVLILTYYWPPSGGAGVQRWLKFVKYLPESGWMPTVITVDPDYAAYPVSDPSLLDDIPADVRVIQTRATNYFRLYSKDPSAIPSGGFANNPGRKIFNILSRFIRGNFFIPDPRRGWNRYAFREAERLVLNEGFSVVITTSPPHSTQLTGLKLKKKYPHIKWIADLRDPWTEIYYYNHFYPSVPARTIDRYYERNVLEKCDFLTTVGKSLGRHFASLGAEPADKIKIIPNGFDEDDFSGITPVYPERFTITFTGTLSDSYPLDGFIQAVKKITDKGFSPLIRFIGLVSDNLKARLTESLGAENIRFDHYMEHEGAIREMASSSVLLLVIASHPQNKIFLSGKLFEYIASGTAILCVGPPDGDAAAIITGGGYGKCFGYDDSEGIEEFIISQLSNPSQKRAEVPAAYSRRSLTNELVMLLQQ